MQAAEEGREAIEGLRLAEVGGGQSPPFEEASDQEAVLMVDHLGRDAPRAGGLLAEPLVAAVDTQHRPEFAQPRDIALSRFVGPDHEVVVRDPTGDALDAQRPSPQLQPAQSPDEFPLRFTIGKRAHHTPP